MEIRDLIPYGRENAVTRQTLCVLTGLNDRVIRNEITKLRRNIPILNLQDGSGYYMPRCDNESEMCELKRFINQESKRARSIFYSLKGAKEFLKENEKHIAS